MGSKFSNSWQKKAKTPTLPSSFETSSYVDSTDKEWIICVGTSSCYLYDVKNDQFYKWIDNYQQDLCDKYKLNHIHSPSGYFGSSHAIDQCNYILYWLDTATHRKDLCKNGNNNYCSLLTIDISDIFNFTIINQTLIDRSCNEYKHFNGRFNTFVAANKVHFIAHTGTLAYYIFDIKSNKVKLINESIQLCQGGELNYDNYQSRNDHDVINMFKTGNMIDVADVTAGRFYLATILEVQDCNNEEYKFTYVKKIKHYNHCVRIA